MSSQESLVKQLMDRNFDQFITRKVSKFFYTVILILTILFVILGMIAGLVNMTDSFLAGLGLLVLSPVAGLFYLVLIRLLFESGIALVLIAENTRPRS